MAESDLGSVTVTPDRGRVGEWGTWIVRYTAGAAGIRQGGGIRVALPITWHQWWRNSARRLQATEPDEPFYVSARASRPGVRVRCEVQEQTPPAPAEGAGPVEDDYVKRARADVDGRPRRYAWVVRVTVQDGDLAPGDAVEVLYGDRSGGSRGFAAPLWGESPERVRAAVDADGGGRFVLLTDAALPWLHTDPGEPAELAVILPSSTVVGEPAEALVVALDPNLNPAWQPGLEAMVRVVEGEADLTPAQGPARGPRPGFPPRHGSEGRDHGSEGPGGSRPVAGPRGGAYPAGIHPPLRHGEGELARATVVALDDPANRSVRVQFVPRAAGIIRLRAQTPDGRLYAHSNPSRCTAAAPAERLYWGDLHGHTRYSADGTGAPDDAFRYARDVAGLEVYGNADHAEALAEGEWDEIVGLNARYYAPGRFVTLVGYESGYRYPYGHHNVFYRGAAGPMIHSRHMTLPDLWAQARATGGPGEVLTIPHHTVALGRPGRPNVDWAIHDDRFRRLVEIYSGHGQSEVSAPDHPLASDVVDFTMTGPADSPSSVQEGWLAGRRLGVIASSDNHCARPGREGFGLMAVYAPALTREAVFDALARRRTYGTTGSRILLDFAVNGTPMGGEVRLRAGQPAELRVEVVGTGALRFVEVLRGDLDAQEWQIARRDWFAGMGAPRELAFTWADPAPPAHGLYYVRVRQRDLVHGRVAMAWSSPVWVDRG